MITIFDVRKKIIYTKTYPRFVALDKFLRDLWPKQIFRRTDSQILKCRMAKILTTVPPGKKTFPRKKISEH